MSTNVFDLPTDQDAKSSGWFTALTPLAFLERSLDVFADKTAIAYGDRRLTYSEFGAAATRLANALRASGIERGDRVAYLCPNIPEMLVANFGVPLAGAVMVPINTRLSAEEVRFICDHSGAKLLVADTEYLPALAPVLGSLQTVLEVVALNDPLGPASPAAAEHADISYDELMARGSGDPLPWTVDDELGLIAINYSSGTTGQPKGAMYTHRGAYLNAMGEIIHQRFDPESVYLWTLPMFHCSGWCTPWAVTGIGATHVCLRAVRADVIWRLLDEERVTHLDGAPTVLVTIAEAPQAHPLERELVATVAGAAPGPTVISRMRELGARIVHVYGMTEAYGPYTINEWQPGWSAMSPADQARRQARQGVAMIQSDPVRVVDKADERCSARRSDDGRDRDAWQQRDGRVLPRRGGHQDRLRGRVAALRGSRRPALGWVCRAAGPGQGHRHLRWREHLHDRDRARDRGASGGVRGRRDRRAGPEVGRAAEGLRRT